jgi:hypothetical protein
MPINLTRIDIPIQDKMALMCSSAFMRWQMKKLLLRLNYLRGHGVLFKRVSVDEPL